MPASQNRSDWRGRWLPVLFWTGVGLAPLAALFLLLGQGGGPLRLAAVLAILCVVLIGLSVALRNDTESVRAQLEAMVLDEVDAVREQTREDIVAVARKLHSTLREEVADLADQVDELRGPQRVDELRGPQRSVGSAKPVSPGYGRGLSPAETAGWRQTTARSEGGGSSRGHDQRPAAAAWSGTQPPQQRNGYHDARTGWPRSGADIPVSPSPVSASPVSPSPVSPGPVSPSPVSGGGLYSGYGSTPGRRRTVEPDALPVAAIESARQPGHGHHPGQRSADPWADLRGDSPPVPAQVSPATPREYGSRQNGNGHPNGNGYLNSNGHPNSDSYHNGGNGYQNGNGRPQGPVYSSHQHDYGQQTHYDHRNDHGYQHADPGLQPQGHFYDQASTGYPNGYAGYGPAGAGFPSAGPEPADPRWGGSYR